MFSPYGSFFIRFNLHWERERRAFLSWINCLLSVSFGGAQAVIKLQKKKVKYTLYMHAHKLIAREKKRRWKGILTKARSRSILNEFNELILVMGAPQSKNTYTQSHKHLHSLWFTVRRWMTQFYILKKNQTERPQSSSSWKCVCWAPSYINNAHIILRKLQAVQWCWWWTRKRLPSLVWYFVCCVPGFKLDC